MPELFFKWGIKERLRKAPQKSRQDGERWTNKFLQLSQFRGSTSFSGVGDIEETDWIIYAEKYR